MRSDRYQNRLRAPGRHPLQRVDGRGGVPHAKAVSGSTAIIKVTYTYNWITPLASSLFGDNTVLLSQTTQMRVE